MSELIALIKAENLEKLALQAANPGTVYGLLSEDAGWWADRNVTTVAQYERWGYECVMSDLAKEAYGTRSMCPDTANMSLAELKEAYEDLSNMAEANFKAEQAEEAEAVVQFEATVAKTIETGAGDRETAITWLRAAEGDEHDDNYFEYCNNLPYGYINGHRPGWLVQ